MRIMKALRSFDQVYAMKPDPVSVGIFEGSLWLNDGKIVKNMV